MHKLHILTDSAASLPEAATENLPLSILPLWVQANDKSYRENIDITRPQLYQLMADGVMPTTSQPAPGDFLETFRPLVDAGKQVIAVLVTGRASGTCDTARIAAKMLPEGAVTVFDSATTAMGTGLQALAAARAIAGGQSLPQVLSLLEEVREQNRIFVAVPTLKFLRRSGRVSLAQSLLAGFLNIKVVLTAQEGLVVVGDKVRTWQNAVQKLEEEVVQGAEHGPLALALHHTDAPDMAEELYQRLRARVQIEECFISELSATLAVHGGPGMLGAAFAPAHLLR